MRACLRADATTVTEVFAPPCANSRARTVPEHELGKPEQVARVDILRPVALPRPERVQLVSRFEREREYTQPERTPRLTHFLAMTLFFIRSRFRRFFSLCLFIMDFLFFRVLPICISSAAGCSAGPISTVVSGRINHRETCGVTTFGLTGYQGGATTCECSGTGCHSAARRLSAVDAAGGRGGGPPKRPGERTLDA
jgi:hypothetical protein